MIHEETIFIRGGREDSDCLGCWAGRWWANTVSCQGEGGRGGGGRMVVGFGRMVEGHDAWVRDQQNFWSPVQDAASAAFCQVRCQNLCVSLLRADRGRGCGLAAQC